MSKTPTYNRELKPKRLLNQPYNSSEGTKVRGNVEDNRNWEEQAAHTEYVRMYNNQELNKGSRLAIPRAAAVRQPGFPNQTTTGDLITFTPRGQLFTPRAQMIPPGAQMFQPRAPMYSPFLPRAPMYSPFPPRAHMYSPFPQRAQMYSPQAQMFPQRAQTNSTRALIYTPRVPILRHLVPRLTPRANKEPLIQQQNEELQTNLLETQPPINLTVKDPQLLPMDPPHPLLDKEIRLEEEKKNWKNRK